ncbi:MAG: hypothetical protein Q4E50_06970 [Tissierellia bacterium]|nr:hypothetical protein [Tissierellia bacterium]
MELNYRNSKVIKRLEKISFGGRMPTEESKNIMAHIVTDFIQRPNTKKVEILVDKFFWIITSTYVAYFHKD